MYTELPHASIDAAIDWGLSRPQPGKRSTRSKTIAVHRRSRDVHMGKALGPGYVELTHAQLKQVAEFDNKYMFVLIGNRVCRQRHGAPMGSNIAPAKAQLTLAHAEHETMKTARERGLIAIANRFMDDVIVATAYDATEPRSKEQAEWL